MDALGFAQQIKRADDGKLLELWRTIDRQYHRFQSKVPHTLIVVGKSRVWGTNEFETLRLNDMFVLYSRRPMQDRALRYFISASLLYQTMLLEKFIPRGGLGFGAIVKGDGLLIGNGFIDAYERAERRPDSRKDVCAVEISQNFLRTLPPSQQATRFLCFYREAFFLHPFHLTDPDLGSFDRERVLACLQDAGVNDAKLSATTDFLEHIEDYDAASNPNSKSREFISIMRGKGAI